MVGAVDWLKLLMHEETEVLREETDSIDTE